MKSSIFSFNCNLKSVWFAFAFINTIVCTKLFSPKKTHNVPMLDRLSHLVSTTRLDTLTKTTFSLLSNTKFGTLVDILANISDFYPIRKMNESCRESESLSLGSVLDVH